MAELSTNLTAAAAWERMKLETQYDYLFADERAKLRRRIGELERANNNLISDVTRLTRTVDRLEARAAKPVTSRKPKGRNRVIWWVTVVLDSPDAAAVLGSLLWQTRRKNGDGPEDGLKVVTYAAEGSVLKLVLDYTVVGGNTADVWRDDPGRRTGMLNRIVKRLGVRVLDIQFDERSRVAVSNDQMPSNGS